MSLETNTFYKRTLDFLATGFYSGRSPRAPGTCGTAVACILAYLLGQICPVSEQLGVSIITALVITLLAIFVSRQAFRLALYGKPDHGDKFDPQQIVIDEFAGFFVTIIAIEHSALNLLLAFVLFRVFDIFKPPPIKLLERLPNGVGVVLDDVMAGVYANLALRCVLLLLA